jgi:hypothetical protein
VDLVEKSPPDEAVDEAVGKVLAQFTCFTSTQAPILALRRLPQAKFTCFTSTQVPILTLRRLSQAKFREQFLLGKAVCDAYTAKTGKSAPVGCAKFPQSDADVGEDPWAKYPAKNFTVLIDEISAERLKKEAAGVCQIGSPPPFFIFLERGFLVHLWAISFTLARSLFFLF